MNPWFGTSHQGDPHIHTVTGAAALHGNKERLRTHLREHHDIAHGPHWRMASLIEEHEARHGASREDRDPESDADLTEVQQDQAERVGHNMVTHVESIQHAVFAAAGRDADGLVVAGAPLRLTGDELLALQGLLTMFKTVNTIFYGGRHGR